VRPQPEEAISAPEFPAETEWLNADVVRLGTLLGQNAVLVWFWDYASLNSLRALPYLMEWHERYSAKGLRIFGVHSPQFEFGKKLANVGAAVDRLEIRFPVANDAEFAIWKLYGNEVWPAIYVWDRTGVLRYFHFAEGEYEETERLVGELLREIDPDLRLPDPMAPLRPTDAPGAGVLPPTPHTYLNDDKRPRAVEAGDELSVSYAGSAAAAVLDGRGGKVDVVLDGQPVQTVELDGPRLYELVDTGAHEQHELVLRFRNEALAYAFSFAPGPA
jgi:hypothetical protein